MLQAGKSLRHAEAGSSVVELALVTPMLLAILVGAADLARVIRDSIVVEGATQAGAHYAAQDEDAAANTYGIANAVFTDLSAENGFSLDNDQGGFSSYSGSNVTVEIERYCKCHTGAVVDCAAPNCGSGAPPVRTYVRVRAEKSFETLINYPGLPTSVTLTHEAHARAT